jgi:hypothetical protein
VTHRQFPASASPPGLNSHPAISGGIRANFTSQTGASITRPALPTTYSVTTTLAPCRLFWGLTHHLWLSEASAKKVPEPPRGLGWRGTSTTSTSLGCARPLINPSHSSLPTAISEH